MNSFTKCLPSPPGDLGEAESNRLDFISANQDLEHLGGQLWRAVEALSSKSSNTERPIPPPRIEEGVDCL